MAALAQQTDLAITSDQEIEAQNLIERGEIDQAIAIYQRLTSDSGHILHRLGVLFAENKGDHYTATKYFQQALEIKEANGDDISDTLTELGFAYQNLRDFDSALIYHLRALALRESKENVDQKLVASSFLGLANAYWGQTDLSQALVYAQRALALNRSLPDNDLQIASNLAILANIYHHSDDHTSALAFSKQALTLLECRSLSNSSSLVVVLNNMGAIQVGAGLFDDALLTFVRLLHIYERILPRGHQKRTTIEENIQRMTKIQENKIMTIFSRFCKLFSKFSFL